MGDPEVAVVNQDVVGELDDVALVELVVRTEGEEVVGDLRRDVRRVEGATRGKARPKGVVGLVGWIG